MEGMLSLRGASGLLETDRSLFTDWSIANRECCIGPINIPNNCLTVKILMQMAELYNVKMWKTTAEEMRRVILTLSSEHGVFGGNGDAAEWVALDSGRKELRRRDIATEGGAALELWSGFHLSDDNYRKLFMLTMGPCPCFRSNPNIGKANQFIGLMIRFDVLAMLGEKETLIRELRNVYLEELRLGSGTFFENINAFSGCHGFNGMAGAYLFVYKIRGSIRDAEVAGSNPVASIKKGPCRRHGPFLIDMEELYQQIMCFSFYMVCRGSTPAGTSI